VLVTENQQASADAMFYTLKSRFDMKKALLVLFLAYPLLFVRSASAQDFTVCSNFVYARTGEAAKLPANATYSQWVLFWVPQGNLSSCSVQVDTSADGVSWNSAALFGPTPCTNPTLTSVRVKGMQPGLTGGYVQINVTALQGNNPISLNVTLQGWSGAF
jgi:hypothetical protein